MLIVQYFQLSQFAELGRERPIELIRVEPPIKEEKI